MSPIAEDCLFSEQPEWAGHVQNLFGAGLNLPVLERVSVVESGPWESRMRPSVWTAIVLKRCASHRDESMPKAGPSYALRVRHRSAVRLGQRPRHQVSRRQKHRGALATSAGRAGSASDWSAIRVASASCTSKPAPVLPGTATTVRHCDP